MKSLLILTGLGLSLNMIGCQGTLPGNSSGVANSAPLYSLLTDEDIQKADHALQYSLESLPSAEQQQWENLSSGNSGVIIPLRTYKSVRGYYCRDYREQIQVSRQQAVYLDTACRSKNGRWYPI